MRSREVNLREDLNNEQGAVLVITALLLFVLFAFAALAIDLSQMAASVEKSRSNAKLAALAALQSYNLLAQNASVSEDAKKAAAVASANQYLGSNPILSMDPHTSAPNTAALPPSSADASAPALMLIPGKYYMSASAVQTCSNPCLTGQNLPCFVPFNDIKWDSCEPAGANRIPSAFRLKGTAYPQLSSAFGNLLGRAFYSLAVDEIATFAPRRGMFLVDISLTLAQQTHWTNLWYTNTSTNTKVLAPSRVAYHLNADNTLITADDPENDTIWNAMNADRSSPPSGAPKPPNPNLQDYGVLHYKTDYAKVVTKLSDYTDVTNYSGSLRSAGSTSTPVSRIQLLADTDIGSKAYPNATKYFYDYHPNKNILDTESGNVKFDLTVSSNITNISKAARVDTFSDSLYSGPQPMTTVFKGLNTAVNSFKARAVAGDKMGLIFFDHKVSWPRTVNLTDDFDYLSRFTDLSIKNDPDRGLQKILRHGIFPSYKTNTNLLLPLQVAQELFNRDSNGVLSTIDFIVLFTDGLSVCISDPGNIPFGTAQCSNDYAHYSIATEELKSFAFSLYQQRIPVNIIAIGGHVGPHTLRQNKPGTTSDCKTDAEIRDQGGFNVSGQDFGTPTNLTLANTAFNSMSESAPFFQANEDMYTIAAMTGGLWAPLRPQSTRQNDCPVSCPATTDPAPSRITYSCRSYDEDVTSYIGNDIMGVTPYTIVPKSD